MTEYDDEVENNDDLQIVDYRISTTANDFNISSIKDFFDKGRFELPLFQRNYVWDIKKASKLIESLIMGLPIPQVFLWQTEKNKMSVIDGQQRLMSIYFFMLGRFPRKDKSAEIRQKMGTGINLPANILSDDKLFIDFKLQLKANKELNYQKYQTLPEDKATIFDMRTLRSIVIKQEDPENNNSMYEIFSRLNTGGTTLKPQEIRMSLNHSDFFEMLRELNQDISWRKIYGKDNLEKHCIDIECITRTLAILLYSENYSSSMMQFLNNFSEEINVKNSKKLLHKHSDIVLRTMFQSFVTHCASSPKYTEYFKNERGGFNLMLFEACFYAAYIESIHEENPIMNEFSAKQVKKISENADFIESRNNSTTSKKNVLKRLEIAQSIICQE